MVELYDGLVAVEPEPLAVARLRHRRGQSACRRRSSSPASTTRPSCGRRASGRSSTSLSSAAPPGLGRATYEPDPDRYEKSWAHCDVLVIGAGPAGLMAALTARPRRRARDPRRRRLAARRHRCSRDRGSTAKPATAFAAQRSLAELAALPNVTLMPRTTVFGWYDDNVFGAVERVQKHVAVPDRARAASSAIGGSSPSGRSWPPVPRSGRWSSAAMTGRA